ncbi:hypothetical protein HQ865_10350 [Mucilaginibacter mali]|uniref:DUF4386 domain-containing protein n=1 Tax=Mucilaginibacter mali TaxID=2740462 RepID=A0A7D4PU53_9SPHI|nr:hypothetical protein [Mucilaginibacter mali]QKJ30143.1 hypothetical protein HQ865_10350 [Mucilaginibacter mali]
MRSANKNTAALFLIANTLYIVCFAILMVWLKQPFIADVTRQPVILSNGVLATIQITMSVLSLLVYMGLAWVLSAHHEKLWIILGVCIYLLLQVYFNLLSVLNIFGQPLPHLFYNYTAYVNYALLLFMLIGMVLVHNNTIREYFRWFGLSTVIAILLVRFMPYLYEHYGLKWALINPGVLKMIPFLVSLFLFVKLSRR